MRSNQTIAGPDGLHVTWENFYDLICSIFIRGCFLLLLHLVSRFLDLSSSLMSSYSPTHPVNSLGLTLPTFSMNLRFCALRNPSTMYIRKHRNGIFTATKTYLLYMFHLHMHNRYNEFGSVGEIFCIPIIMRITHGHQVWVAIRAIPSQFYKDTCSY